jgi:hypothetical protein
VTAAPAGLPWQPPYGYAPAYVGQPAWCCAQDGASFGSLPAASETFDVVVLRITRPWFDESTIFGAGLKTWRPGPGGQALSDGTVATTDGTKPPMTFLPTALVFARDLRITGTWSKDLLHALHDAASLRGNYLCYRQQAATTRFSWLAFSLLPYMPSFFPRRPIQGPI